MVENLVWYAIEKDLEHNKTNKMTYVPTKDSDLTALACSQTDQRI